MTKASVWTAAAIGLATLAGCAAGTDDPASAGQAGARPAPQCFLVSSVRNFRVVNSTTVNIRVGRDAFYRLDMFGPCPDLAWNNTMAIHTRGSSRLCAGRLPNASIFVRGSTGRQRCAISSITALTPDEVAALPARDRP